MKQGFLLYSLILLFLAGGFTQQPAPTWTTDELKAANTGLGSKYLEPEEKEALKYINLARLYPKKFVLVEVQKYYGPVGYGDYLKGSPYRKSLISDLNKMKPVKALLPDSTLTKTAECLGKEQEKSGKVGHERSKKCKSDYYAECCAYGMLNGKDAAMQLLVDHGVPSLGHRKACLNGDYTKAGLSYNKHKTEETVMVVDLK
ncbi:MAG: hypothetical protein AB1458_01520 [Bacteroidota bacterium]